MTKKGEKGRRNRTAPPHGMWAPNGEWVPTGYAIEDAVLALARWSRRAWRSLFGS